LSRSKDRQDVLAATGLYGNPEVEKKIKMLAPAASEVAGSQLDCKHWFGIQG